MKYALSVVSIVFVAFLVAACTPQYPPIFDPASLKGTTAERTVSDGRSIYKFQVTEFAKPVKAPLVERKAASYATPEEAVASHLSAMKSLDYEWFRMSWDNDALKALDERDKQGNVTPEKWKGRWKFITTKTFELTHRIEYKSKGKEYTLVAYQEPIEFPKEGIKSHCIPLRKEGKRWYITQDLQTDPGYGHVDELIGSGNKGLDVK
jgi:hypothetical protein